MYQAILFSNYINFKINYLVILILTEKIHFYLYFNNNINYETISNYINLLNKYQ